MNPPSYYELPCCRFPSLSEVWLEAVLVAGHLDCSILTLECAHSDADCFKKNKGLCYLFRPFPEQSYWGPAPLKHTFRRCSVLYGGQLFHTAEPLPPVISGCGHMSVASREALVLLSWCEVYAVGWGGDEWGRDQGIEGCVLRLGKGQYQWQQQHRYPIHLS